MPFHRLKIATKIRLNPAIYISKSIEEHLILVAYIRLSRYHVVIFVLLNNYKEHVYCHARVADQGS